MAGQGSEHPTRLGMRLDKWLWAARFFKTRALAARSCELGRITLGNQPLKPAREIHAGEMLRIKNEGGEYDVEVLGLSEMRGPAAVAQALYRETDDSKTRRQQLIAARKAMPQFELEREGRPSKRDRRRLSQLRGR